MKPRGFARLTIIVAGFALMAGAVVYVAVNKQSISRILGSSRQADCSQLNEEKCFAAPYCHGLYGPSSCSGGFCTADEAFKGCEPISYDVAEYKELCARTGGTWTSNVDKFNKPGRCNCKGYFNDKEGCVALEPDTLSLRGTFVPGGIECRRFQTDDGKFYTLVFGETANKPEFKNGDRAVIQGVAASQSYCQQDTTINVSTISRVGAPPAALNISGVPSAIKRGDRIHFIVTTSDEIIARRLVAVGFLSSVESTATLNEPKVNEIGEREAVDNEQPFEFYVAMPYDLAVDSKITLLFVGFDTLGGVIADKSIEIPVSY